jgi:hypothetical protein
MVRLYSVIYITIHISGSNKLIISQISSLVMEKLEPYNFVFPLSFGYYYR